MNNLGLVLEGGALRGQYTAGVLEAFLEHGVEFPYVIGVSAGATVAVSYLSKQRGRNQEIIERYRPDSRYLSWGNFFRTGSLFGMEFIYEEIHRRLHPFDDKAFHDNPARFITVCTDVDTGEAVYYGKDADLSRVVRASSSMPFVSTMVEYEGRRLLDGALADSLPWRKAAEDGFPRAVVILTRPLGYRKKPSSPWLARLVYGRFPRLVEAIGSRWKQYNESLEAIEAAERRGEVLVLRPSVDLKVSRTEKSVAKLTELYELGRSDGRAALANRAFF